MSQEAAARPFSQSATYAFKPTFAVLSEIMVDAANSVDLRAPEQVGQAFGKLRDQLFLSPRLSQWQLGTDEKGNRGYWLKSKDEVATVTVREDRVILSTIDHDHPKYPFNYDVVIGLPAATLYKSIQDAQAIVLPRGGLNGMATNDEGEEFFGDDPEFDKGAGLDAALEETHPGPLVEDDAELIEEVCAVGEEEGTSALDRIEKMTDRTEYPEDEEVSEKQPEDELMKDLKEITGGFTAQANRKNAVTDGVICSYCGNLNQSAYKGTCPKCPKRPSGEGAKQAALVQASLTVPKKDMSPGRDNASEAWLMSRLKSMQGRVLTILDASPIADKAQRDAVKTLVNKEFRREMNKVSDGGWRANDPRYEE